MTETLGVAASVIAVIQITAVVVSLCQEYISKMVQAPGYLQRFMKELKLLATILSNLHISAYDNPEVTKLWNLESPIKDCIADFGSLKAKLESKKKGWLSTFVGLQWPFDEKGTMEYLLQVERLKSHFLLALAVDQQ